MMGDFMNNVANPCA